MLWFPTIGGIDPLLPYPSDLSRMPEARRLDADLDDPAIAVDVTPRSEHGARAMKLPARVARAFGAGGGAVQAPSRDEQKELAGLVLLPPRHVDATTNRMAASVLGGDVLAADRLSAGGPIAADQTIGARMLQSLRSRRHLLSSARSEATPPPFVGPTRPEFWQPEVVLIDPAVKPPLLLPQSNRALGRRILPSSRPEAPEPAVVAPPIDAAQASPNSMLGQATDSDRSVASQEPVVTIEVDDAVSDQRPAADRTPAGWPVTQRLDEQLEALSTMVIKDRDGVQNHLVSSATGVSPMVRWSNEVSRRLRELRTLPRLGEPRAGVLIDELAALANEGSEDAEQLTDRGAQIEWLCASCAVARRMAIWRPIWQVTSVHDSPWMISDEPSTPSPSVQQAIDLVRSDLVDTGDESGWTRYLLLDDVRQAEQSSRTHPLDGRKVLAQRFLSRLVWHGLDPEQRRWIQRDSIMQLAACVRPWACDAVDYANLVRQIERQETDAIDLAAIEIANAVQTLRFAESADAVRVADAINTHYRNANVRLALSTPMLQRMLPAVEPQTVPVRTRILGSQIRGKSQIRGDLHVQLNPSPDRWSLSLQTHGSVRTTSTGFNGPVAVRTMGNSGFAAKTPIEVTTGGVRIGDSDVDVRSRTRLRDVRSDYDRWPLIGSLVRGVAENRYQSLALQSNRIGSQKMRQQIRTEIDSKLDKQLGLATDRLGEMVLGPLGRLRLDPKVTDMQTTDQRLLARYRLAGDWQLGAFTPRPRALRSSLMSVQVHQSALNNTLEQLVPRDQPILIRDMLRDSAEVFGQQSRVPEDIPQDVTVLFARTRPITVEIDEGRMWVTLRIVRLTRNDRLDLTQFIVRAAYKPQISGMKASLVRDGHLRISGPRMSMRERLPVRAIFNKVLSPNRPLPLITSQLADHAATDGLAVSQLELREGWIAISISPSDAPRIALKQ